MAAIDASEFEADRVSNYFVRRRAAFGKQTGNTTKYRRFPKLAVVCDCSSHLILAAVPHRDPSPDFYHWSRAMDDAWSRVRMTRLLADAEWAHVAARIVFGTPTLLTPLHGRPIKKLPTAYYRRRMAGTFATKRKRKPYRHRAQVKAVLSILKHRLDSSVNASGY